MTSYYAQHRQLSRETYDLRQYYSHSIEDRLQFYIAFLEDVVPDGITVDHNPASSRYFHSMQSAPVQREEIMLSAHNGRIFMTGLVSMENSGDGIQNRAGGEAYTYWRHNEFVDDTWRFFSGTTSARFCNGYESNGADWECIGDFDPSHNAERIAEYLQDEYDQLNFYAQL